MSVPRPRAARAKAKEWTAMLADRLRLAFDRIALLRSLHLKDQGDSGRERGSKERTNLRAKRTRRKQRLDRCRTGGKPALSCARRQLNDNLSRGALLECVVDAQPPLSCACRHSQITSAVQLCLLRVFPRRGKDTRAQPRCCPLLLYTHSWPPLGRRSSAKYRARRPSKSSGRLPSNVSGMRLPT